MTDPPVELSDALRNWLATYPASAAEDAALAACAAADEPTPELVLAALETNPLRKAWGVNDRRLESVKPENWPATHHRLVVSLTGADDVIALINLTAIDGVGGLGVTTGSLILAAFQPKRFVPFFASSRRVLEQLNLLEQRNRRAIESNEWGAYLAACRWLSFECELTLQEVGRALGARGFMPRGGTLKPRDVSGA